MDMIEKTVKTNYVYQGKILSLRNDDALLSDGTPCKREIVEHSGGACVLYVENGCVLLVKQYRYAYGEILYEIPAGKLEKGEDPALTAIRELEEETGIKTTEVELLFIDYPSPGYTNEKIYIYEAKNGIKTAQRLDEGEFLAVERVPLEKAKQMLYSGEIKDGKTVIALLHYFARK
ncbi:MAG: NUDIX hydrolase [Clostridiales bacterium]|nr:NUDIX hydrolase [Clostridiales bacterium]